MFRKSDRKVQMDRGGTTQDAFYGPILGGPVVVIGQVKPDHGLHFQTEEENVFWQPVFDGRLYHF